jgi:hypothetical protein
VRKAGLILTKNKTVLKIGVLGDGYSKTLYDKLKIRLITGLKMILRNFEVESVNRFVAVS